MVDLISLDNEKIYRVLTAHDMPPPVREIIIEIHETQRATQQLVNELMTHIKSLSEIVTLLTKSNDLTVNRLQKIERKYQGDDLGAVTSEHLRS